MKKNKILWVDDEIELLKSHVLFLKSKGFDVETATNGKDAVNKIENGNFDLALVDEMMPGMSGLETIEKIKQENSALPIVMITKNEEESLMEKAIGRKISDYLTKPVNPSQILMACKQILEREKISSEHISRSYMKEFREISSRLYEDLNYEDWIDINQKLAEYEVEFDDHPDLGMNDMLQEQKKNCNVEFGKFIENKYQKWLDEDKHFRPTLSNDIMEDYVINQLKNAQKVLFIVIDCMRLDQWLTFAPLLYDYFDIDIDYYFSILPSATPFSRNAIFSGKYPSEIHQNYSDIWNDDDKTMNYYEPDLLKDQLKKAGLLSVTSHKYIKVINSDKGWRTNKQIKTYLNQNLITLVINFVDILAHRRSDSEFLKEVVPDEASYRSVVRTWFKRSWIFSLLKKISKYDFKVVLTTDHGSIRVMNDVKIKGDRDTSPNVRFKYGTNLNASPKQALVIKDPEKYKLPSFDVNTNYLISKEDFYFVYPTEYNKYKNQYHNTFQHGGISLEEMILPVIELTPKG
ncbi:MAG: bifunctional response regulator/alkaline phosphatase family protein [Candidatus Marinimicrobia bacterium]|nr:bifunctional response regulator/alkaline phosphatase family protein [Candidatus Neomarinimicrobiota bacterium]